MRVSVLLLVAAVLFSWNCTTRPQTATETASPVQTYEPAFEPVPTPAVTHTPEPVASQSPAPVTTAVPQPSPTQQTVQQESPSLVQVPAQPKTVSVVIPIRYISQQSEPAPAGWNAWYTPYCVAASAAMVFSAHGVALPHEPLQTFFRVGRSGNTTEDPGIDPDGALHLMKSLGGNGAIHMYADPSSALTALVKHLASRSPVVVFTQAGNHAVVAYGFEAVEGGSPVTALYLADPLGSMGRVPIQNAYQWFGKPFSAPGEKWRGKYVFVTFD